MFAKLLAVLGAPTARPVALLLACLGLASCGGDESGGGASGAAEAPAETASATTADPRAGYFGARETKTLNPPLGRFDRAWTRYTRDAEKCDREAQRLYAQGASPRESVRCHLRANRGLSEALAGLRTSLDALDGSYRDACDAQVERFTDAVDETRAARERVLAGWSQYAARGRAPAMLQRATTRADELSGRLLETEIVTLSRACYTEEDLEQAETEAER